MSQQSGDCQFGKSYFGAHGAEAVAQDVDSDAIQFRSSTQTLQHLRKSDEMPTAPIGGKYPWGPRAPRQNSQQLDGGATYGTLLGSGLRIGESETGASRVDRFPSQRKRLHAAQPSQQQESDGGYPGATFNSTRLGLCYCRTELANLFKVQKSPLLSIRQPSDSARRVLLNEPVPFGEFKYGAEHTDGTTGHAAPARGDPTSPCASFCGFAGSDCGLHLFDIDLGKAGHRASTD
jgi:hypothetical protein